MEDRSGWYQGIGAYLIWGLFPLYFHLLSAVGAIEIVSHRVIWSLVFCIVLMLVTNKLKAMREALRQPRITIVLLVAGLLVTTNWTLYVWGVTNGHTLDASLGYFINPLVNAALGLILFKEKMRPAQWVAFGVGGLAIIELVIGYGSIPWVALGLAATFGAYGALKKQVSGTVSALPGMVIESTAALPFALGYLIYLYANHFAAISNPISGLGAMAVGAGILTAVPLLMFAAAAARLPLSMIGIIQYMTPIMQFLCGWAIFHEEMPLSRWIGFAMIWVAVIIFVADAFAASRRTRRKILVPLEAQ